MKFKELKELSVQDLDKHARELKLELMKENAQVAIGTVPKNPGKLRATKREIARINMIQNTNAKQGGTTKA